MTAADPPTDAPTERPSAWRWWVCGLLLLATVLNYMDRMALNQTSVRVKQSLGLSDLDYARLESGFSAAFAAGAVLTGYVVDRVNVRWVYPVVVTGWSVAGLLTGYASSFATLLACRVLLGLFEAGNWPCGIRTTRTVLPPAERSMGNAIFQSGTVLGAVLIAALMPTLLDWADPGEKGRRAVMAVTGGSYEAVTVGPSLSWQAPFRLIGLLGLGWVAVWFLTVPGRRLLPVDPTPAAAAGGGPAGFGTVVRDRRFWLLLLMAVAVNVAWHGYRVWLPSYLQKTRGFSESEMNGFTVTFYLSADAGSLLVGVATIRLARRLGVHAARLAVYALCAGLALLSLAVPQVADGVALRATLLVLAFGVLGLFPTYFALSQELSAKHQGKVTGVLGASAHLSLAAIYEVEGRVIEATGSYAGVLAAIGVFPALVLLLMLWAWPPRRSAS